MKCGNSFSHTVGATFNSNLRSPQIFSDWGLGPGTDPPVTSLEKLSNGNRRMNQADMGIRLRKVSEAFVSWAEEREIELRFIEPGKPNQNAFIERFNRTYRTEVLNAYVFESIEQVQQITDAWLIEYNEERPHDALGRVPPLTYLPRETTTGESSFKLSP